MPIIKIISASIRRGRLSHRVAIYFKNFLEGKNIVSVEIIDLDNYAFPLFDERLRFQESPSEAMLDFAGKIKESDGIIIVTPEYNGGYPASLKNAIDLLSDEWVHRPVAIATVSDGIFGGTQVIISLQFVLWKMKAWVVSARFPVTRVQESFDENGIPADKVATDRRAGSFIDELLWCIEARSQMGK